MELELAEDDAPATRRELREALETFEAIAKADFVAFLALVDQLQEAGVVDTGRLMGALRGTEEDARKRNEHESLIKTLRSYRLGLADALGLPDDPEGR